MKFRISFTTASFFCVIMTIFLMRSDSSIIYKHISPYISTKVFNTAAEDFNDSDSNAKTTSHLTEKISNDYHRRYAEFTSTIAKDNLKTPQKTRPTLSKCRSDIGHLSTNFQSQKSQTECKSLPIPEMFRTQYTNILSPDVFAQLDPLQYLLNKVEKLTFFHSLNIKAELSSRLQCKELFQCYFPYAKVLWSILQCWYLLARKAGEYMEKIRAQRSSDINQSFSLTEEISSSDELSQLYSSDILNDPEPARRLLFTFLNMPEDGIEKLKTKLRNFLQNWSRYSTPMSYWYYYVGYARAMFNFLENELAFESIKRDVAEIRAETSIQASNQIL